MIELTESEEEHMRCVRYFIEEKGDPTRYTEWAEAREVLKKHYPEVLKAWEDHVAAERLLYTLVKNL